MLEAHGEDDIVLPRRSKWPWALAAMAAVAAFWVIGVGLPETTRGGDASLAHDLDIGTPANMRPMEADAAPPATDTGGAGLDASADARVRDTGVKDARARAMPRPPRKPTVRGRPVPAQPVTAPAAPQGAPVSPPAAATPPDAATGDVVVRDAGSPPSPAPDKGPPPAAGPTIDLPLSPEDRKHLLGGSR